MEEAVIQLQGDCGYEGDYQQKGCANRATRAIEVHVQLGGAYLKAALLICDKHREWMATQPNVLGLEAATGEARAQ